MATTRRVATALDPATGETLWMWRLDEGIRWQKAARQLAGRGLAYWTDGREERVVVVTPGYHMASLDAKTGVPDPRFGRNGVVDLMEGLGLPLVPLAWTTLVLSSSATPLHRAGPARGDLNRHQDGADGTVGIDPAGARFPATAPPSSSTT